MPEESPIVERNPMAAYMGQVWVCDCEFSTCMVILKSGGPPDTCSLDRNCVEQQWRLAIDPKTVRE